MSDDEILELGPDGTFEIPKHALTQAKASVDDVTLDYSNIEISLDDDDNIGSSNDKLLDLEQGSYRIVKSDKHIFVIIRLFGINETVTEVAYLKPEVTIQTTDNKKYTITLKDIEVDAKSGACTRYNDLLTIRYLLL